MLTSRPPAARSMSFTSVAPVLLAAGMLTLAGGSASHAADGKPDATGRTPSASELPAALARADEWTVTIVPAGRNRTIGSELSISAGPAIFPVGAASTPPGVVIEVSDDPAPLPAGRDSARSVALVGAGEPPQMNEPPAPLAVRYRTYRDAYRAIPFSRAEYEANPSYRHDAAMELLFGRMRPTVIHRHVAQPRPAQSVAIFSPFYYYPPLQNFARGPYSRYPGLFGYQGGYRIPF